MSYSKFLSYVDALSQVPRRGWKLRGIEKPETVLEHSFRVAILALLVRDYYEVDGEKLLSLALIHDLAEALAGDITPFDGIGRDEKEKREKEAFEIMTSELPEALKEEFLFLWKELKSCKTLEARLVKQLDKIDMAFKARMYEDEGYKNLEEFVEEARKEVKDERLKKILEEITE